MTKEVIAGDEGSGGDACRTVVVGVKLDAHSRELLTWALVKVAQPGDLVIALHVLNSNEITDRDGKSSLLSLVKAFDSVLTVYEGFCNLKQVDLKLKVCRGESLRKILVHEAKSYHATGLIVGTAKNHHTIRSSTSVAKYCAKKLAKDCSVLAVNNGKIVFHKGDAFVSRESVKETEHRHHQRSLLSVIQRTLSKKSNVLNDGNLVKACDGGTYGTTDLALVKDDSESAESALKQSCSICSSISALMDDSGAQTQESSTDDSGKSSMAIVPAQKLEAASGSLNLSIRELPELKPGWPLLCRALSSKGQVSGSSSMRKISVVQWAMRLPSRSTLPIKSLDDNRSDCDRGREESSELDAGTGAIVPVGRGTSGSSSPNRKSVDLPEELEGLHEKYSATCRLFKYEELLSATSNFTPGNIIGKGGSSQVYKGCLPDGKDLAVKILKPSEDAVKEFGLEIEIITTLHHKNIISLFGFCYEQNRLLLVYDFLSRGSLEQNLHGDKKDPLSFRWNERHRVAVGIAEALNYLHNRDVHPVIHRDVKSSNILLSDDFEPQLSDFGLAKWASTISSHITCTDVAGTFGYMAPEYFMYGKVNEKVDVYAFGVVLLELLSGRKPISTGYPKGQESLVMWAKPILSHGKFTRLLDPSLDSNYNCEVERMVLAAALCIRRAPRARPKMSKVLKLLEGDTEIIEWARLQVNAMEGSQTNLQIPAIEGSDPVDEEAFSDSNLQSHLNLALQGVEEDTLSINSSIEQSISVEDYLRGRWSRSSSLD